MTMHFEFRTGADKCKSSDAAAWQRRLSWLDKLAMPIAVVIGSGLVSWSIKHAELAANRTVEMNKMVMALHSAEGDARKGPVIGLAQFENESFPYLAGSLDSDSYPEAVLGLRTKAGDAAAFLNQQLRDGKYAPQALLRALGDLGVPSPETAQTLEMVLTRDPAITRRFFVTDELRQTAALSWIKLRYQHLEVYELIKRFEGVDFHSHGLVDIRDLKLSRMTLHDVDLSRIDASGARFNNTSIKGSSRMRHARLIGAKFRDSYIWDADLTGSDLTGADFSGAELRGVRFNKAKLRDAILNGATLIDCQFAGTDLTGVRDAGATYLPVRPDEGP
jgi:hypothetical protein